MNDWHKVRNKTAAEMNQKKAIQIAVAIIAATIFFIVMIPACNNLQQNADKPQWSKEMRFAVDSAKTDGELFQIIDQYAREFATLDNRRYELVRANRNVELNEMQYEFYTKTKKLSHATQRFLILYPQSKHYAEVDSIRGSMMKIIGYSAEEIIQDAMEIRRRQGRQ